MKAAEEMDRVGDLVKNVNSVSELSATLNTKSSTFEKKSGDSNVVKKSEQYEDKNKKRCESVNKTAEKGANHSSYLVFKGNPKNVV